jgi:hypothetical protein
MRHHKLHKIETDYDPDNDVRPNGPPVTWGEKALLDEVLRLMERVTVLETKTISQVDKSSVKVAQSINLDDAVRVIAKSGKNHDRGPNWYAEWGDMTFKATFGAGTNSASVSVVSNDWHVNHILLYSASEYGRHIETFRYGPWVNRLLAYVDELRRDAKVKNQERQAQEAAMLADNFKEVDF